jgi:hypothetical protein
LIIKLTSTGTSNRASNNTILCRRGCIVGSDVLITSRATYRRRRRPRHLCAVKTTPTRTSSLWSLQIRPRKLQTDRSPMRRRSNRGPSTRPANHAVSPSMIHSAMKSGSSHLRRSAAGRRALVQVRHRGRCACFGYAALSPRAAIPP